MHSMHIYNIRKPILAKYLFMSRNKCDTLKTILWDFLIFFFIFVYLKFSLEQKVWVKNDWFLFLIFFFRYIFCHFDRIDFFFCSSGGCHILHWVLICIWIFRGFAFIKGRDDDRFIGIFTCWYNYNVYNKLFK